MLDWLLALGWPARVMLALVAAICLLFVRDVLVRWSDGPL